MIKLKRDLTSIDCYNWRRNKLKNPITGYKIKEKSPIYNLIEKLLMVLFLQESSQ